MELFASHCVFPTPDICKTAEYYHDKLGFRRVDYLNAKEKHEDHTQAGGEGSPSCAGAMC